MLVAFRVPPGPAGHDCGPGPPLWKLTEWGKATDCEAEVPWIAPISGPAFPENKREPNPEKEGMHPSSARRAASHLVLPAKRREKNPRPQPAKPFPQSLREKNKTSPTLPLKPTGSGQVQTSAPSYRPLAGGLCSKSSSSLGFSIPRITGFL